MVIFNIKVYLIYICCLYYAIEDSKHIWSRFLKQGPRGNKLVSNREINLKSLEIIWNHLKSLEITAIRQKGNKLISMTDITWNHFKSLYYAKRINFQLISCDVCWIACFSIISKGEPTDFLVSSDFQWFLVISNDF
jgi:hypothetical protein